MVSISMKGKRWKIGHFQSFGHLRIPQNVESSLRSLNFIGQWWAYGTVSYVHLLPVNSKHHCFVHIDSFDLCSDFKSGRVGMCQVEKHIPFMLLWSMNGEDLR